MSVAEKTKPTIIQPNKMGLLVENQFINHSDIHGVMTPG